MGLKKRAADGTIQAADENILKEWKCGLNCPKKQVLQHPVTSYIIPRHLGHQVTHVTIRWMLCTFSFFHFFIFLFFFPIFV